MTATPGPRRIQLRRTKGWRKPAGAVVVARPTRWGNPFVVVDTRIVFRGTELWSGFRDHTAAVRHAVLTFGWHIDHHPDVLGFTRDQVVEQLHGKDLACWCPLLTEHGTPAPCHADVLLAIANPAGPHDAFQGPLLGSPRHEHRRRCRCRICSILRMIRAGDAEGAG